MPVTMLSFRYVKILRRRSGKDRPFQIIFVSYGSHVIERFGMVDSYSLPYSIGPLQQVLDDENEHLQNGYPIKTVRKICLEKTYLIGA